jgi:hypothetical protein
VTISLVLRLGSERCISNVSLPTSEFVFFFEPKPTVRIFFLIWLT